MYWYSNTGFCKFIASHLITKWLAKSKNDKQIPPCTTYFTRNKIRTKEPIKCVLCLKLQALQAWIYCSSHLSLTSYYSLDNSLKWVVGFQGLATTFEDLVIRIKRFSKVLTQMQQKLNPVWDNHEPEIGRVASLHFLSIKPMIANCHSSSSSLYLILDRSSLWCYKFHGFDHYYVISVIE